MAACCWICLEETGQLCTDACSCPRPVHPVCLALWCATNSGRPEERSCRFCSHPLPRWEDVLLPKRDQVVHAAPEALINVHGPDGSTHLIPLRPGLAGRRRFMRSVRDALGLPEHAHIDLSFEVAVPLVQRAPRSSLPAQLPQQRIHTRDFSLASHMATLNAGMRRRRAEHQQQQVEALASEGATGEACSKRTRR